MNIQITNINIQYENDELSNVQIYFSGHDDERTVHLNGFVPLSSEEYAGNESVSALATLIKQKVYEKLNPAE